MVFVVLLGAVFVLLVFEVVRFARFVKPGLYVSCAGSVNSNTPEKKVLPGFDWKAIKPSDGTVLSPDKYDVFSVKGSSMLLGGIQDGDVLFVKKGVRGQLEVNYPAFVVLRREDDALCEAAQIKDFAKFKVRRTWFETDLSQVTDEELAERIKSDIIEKEKFAELKELGNKNNVTFPDTEALLSDFKKRVLRYRETHGGSMSPVLISSTLNTDDNCVHFSVHSKDMLVGEVKYDFKVGANPTV